MRREVDDPDGEPVSTVIDLLRFDFDLTLDGREPDCRAQACFTQTTQWNRVFPFFFALQEADLDFERRALIAGRQALRLHPRAFAPAWFESSEVPAVLVLHGGFSIRVEEIPFVENGVRDLLHRGEAHDDDSSVESSSARASSNVATPRDILYRESRSNTSRCNRSQALFG